MWRAANFIFTTLYNNDDVDNNAFFFLGFCSLEMEKIKPVYAPKDFFEVHVFLKPPTTKEQGSQSLEKSLNLGKLLEKFLNSSFFENSLNCRASPWKVLEFCSTLDLVAWKVFF